MVVDDGDEGFGDFTFAPPNQTVHFNPKIMNSPDVSTFNNDDDWGDFNFVNSGGGGGGGALDHAISFPNHPNPLELSGFSVDQQQKNESEQNRPGSAPGRVSSVTTPWKKPTGALPLSFFGDVEEEEELDASNPAFTNGGANLFSNNKNVDSVKKGSGMNVNNLIANLYQQNEAINGPKSDPNRFNSAERRNKLDAKLDPNVNVLNLDAVRPNSSSHELISNWDWENSNGNGTNELKSNSQGFYLGWDPSNLNAKGLDLNPEISNLVTKNAELSASEVVSASVDGNEEFDDEGGDEDDDGWEFMGAESKTVVSDEVSQTNQMMSMNGSMSNLNEINPSWSAQSLDSNGWTSNAGNISLSTNKLNVDPVDEVRELANDDWWQFKDVSPKTKVGDETSKGRHIKSASLSNLNLDGSNISWDGLNKNSSSLNSDLGGLNTDVKQLDSDLIAEKIKEFDNGSGWWFADAEPQLHVKDANSKGDQIKPENGAKLNSNEANISSNILTLDGGGMRSNLNGVNSDAKPVNLSLDDENDDFEEDDGWQFQAAESESRGGVDNTEGDVRRLGNYEEVQNTLGFAGGAHVPVDLFGASQGTRHNHDHWGFGFDFNSSSSGTIYDMNSGIKQSDTENRLHSMVDGKVVSDENSWAFEDAFSKVGSKEEPMVAEVASAGKAFTFDGELQVNKVMCDNQKGALPLSLFGEEEEESDDPVIYHDISTQMPLSNQRDLNLSFGPNVSINDLISSLYSQIEEHNSVNHAQIPIENGWGSTKSVMASDLVNGDDDINDGSWEFKDASPESRAEDLTSVHGVGESHAKYSAKVELNDFVKFFSKLKEELHFVVLDHLDILKKAQNAAFSVEDAEGTSLDKEIQYLDNELCQYGGVSSKVHSENLSPRNICIKELVEALQEPNFQVFESEYQLSKNLLLVETDLRYASSLLKLVASILKILTLVSREEQISYVSAWSKMLSVCAGELKHGALIWKQSLQENVHDKILSTHQGKKYIHALGEIYRVAEVLGSSVRLYKPWILASYPDPVGMTTVLSECSTLWTSSGLDEALQSISDGDGFECDGSTNALLKSINYIHDLDVLTLYNHVFSKQDPICRLSVLPAAILPGMKTVVWNEECYFLTLANLWANLISCNPPDLPHIQVG